MWKNDRPSREDVMKVVTYDPDNGTFVWRHRVGVKDGAAAGTMADGYVQIKLFGRLCKAHRLAWLIMTGQWPDGLIDHIDQNRSNNKWSNLRLADQSKNQANSKVHVTNTSGFKGVCWDNQVKKWKARVHFQGKQVHCGFYSDAAQAGAAYKKKVRELFGEFAP